MLTQCCCCPNQIILDDNKQAISTPGTPGEIFAKGFNIDGYHKQEAKTEEAKYGDYFSVGDVGYLDADGFLYISDRKIDMVSYETLRIHTYLHLQQPSRSVA